MLDIEDYQKLSPEARKYYGEHREYYDEMADKWNGYIDMPTIIKTDMEKEYKKK